MDERRVMVITGASTGIGAATARLLVADGWRVVLASRRAAPLEALAEELGGGDVALAVPTDVSEWDQVEALAAKTISQFGRIDAAFINAGFGAKRGFLESTPEQWKSMVLTNVYGAAITARAVLPHLPAPGGHVIFTSSTAGRRVIPGSLYSATKWAVSAMGEALRQEVSESGVRVTLVAPGLTDTPFFDDPLQADALRPEDIAEAVRWVTAQPATVNVAEVVVRPTTQSF